MQNDIVLHLKFCYKLHNEYNSMHLETELINFYY
jgi:hypothetical protein